MDADADDGRKRFMGRGTLEQVFVPITHVPFWRGGAGNAGEGEAWSEDMLAETGVWILWVKGIQE